MVFHMTRRIIEFIFTLMMAAVCLLVTVAGSNSYAISAYLNFNEALGTIFAINKICSGINHYRPMLLLILPMLLQLFCLLPLLLLSLNSNSNHAHRDNRSIGN